MAVKGLSNYSAQDFQSLLHSSFMSLVRHEKSDVWPKPKTFSLKRLAEWRRLSGFPAKMLLVDVHSLLSIEKILFLSSNLNFSIKE